MKKGKVYEFLNEKIEPAFPNNKFDSATVFDAFKNAIVKRNDKYGMIKPDGEFKVASNMTSLNLMILVTVNILNITMR